MSAVSDLAARLVDPAHVRWTIDELEHDLAEALRTWNALTESTHETGTFETAGTTAFYDLAQVLPTVRGYTLTDQHLITSMQYTLLEPPQGSTWNTWAGTDQFTLADLASALQYRRDQFLRETSAVLARQLLPISPPPNGRIQLPEVVIEPRRAMWLSTPDAVVAPLLRDDEWAFNHFSTNWAQGPTRPPQTYSVGAAPPLMIQLAPPPQDTGVLDLVSINRGAAFTPATGPTLLGVPDDWAWVVRFGALADLLSKDGLSQDLGRAAYFESRFRHGVKLARLAGVVLTARIDNTPCTINSLADMDTYQPLWQTTSGTVAQVLTAGHNLLAVIPPPGPQPGGEPWSITLDVVANAVVPASFLGYFPLGPEVYSIVLDYAEHLALIKEGPALVDATQPLVDRFMRAAGVTLAIERETVPNRQFQRVQSADPTRTAPLMTTDTAG